LSGKPGGAVNPDLRDFGRGNNSRELGSGRILHKSNHVPQLIDVVLSAFAPNGHRPAILEMRCHADAELYCSTY
jgi:hypothetical protein